MTDKPTTYIFVDNLNIIKYSNLIDSVKNILLKNTVDKKNLNDLYFFEENQGTVFGFLNENNSLSFTVKKNYSSSVTKYNVSNNLYNLISFFVENIDSFNMKNEDLYNINLINNHINNLVGNITVPLADTNNQNNDHKNFMIKIEDKKTIEPENPIKNLSDACNEIKSSLQNIQESKPIFKKKNILNKEPVQEQPKVVPQESPQTTVQEQPKAVPQESPQTTVQEQSKVFPQESPQTTVQEQPQEVKELEELAEDLKNKIEEEKKKISDEEKNLISQQQQLEKQRQELKKKNKELESKKSIYLSEYEFTYKQKLFPKIFEKKLMLVKDISPLFFTKFFVLLFMEGRDSNGNINPELQVLVNREDSYLIYHYLIYISTTDDNISEYEFSDEINMDTYMNYGMSFLENMPEDLELYSSQQYMDKLNKKTEAEHPMFVEKTTGEVEEVESISSNEDQEIDDNIEIEDNDYEEEDKITNFLNKL